MMREVFLSFIMTILFILTIKVQTKKEALTSPTFSGEREPPLNASLEAIAFQQILR
jgi:hypothetical protein